MGISTPTVSSYIDFLENAFLIRRLPSFYVNLRKRLVKSPKIYFRDTGILHRLLGISTFDELHGHIILGNSWEGFAIQQILANISPDIRPFFYRTQDGSELDLILVRGDRPIAGFEIKYTDSPKISRGNTIAMQDLGAARYFIVTPSSDDYPLRENVRVCSLGSIKRYLEEMKLTG